MRITKQSVWSKLQNTQHPVILYGTGNGADKILDEMERRGTRPVGIMASDGFVRGQLFRGYQVQILSELKKQYPQPIIVPAFGSGRPEVMELILRLHRQEALLFADVPVYGDELFDRAFYERHYQELEKVCGMLEDEQSRLVLESVINFKLSGELTYLTQAFTPKDEAFESILSLGCSESYLDLGAYRGDTIDEFLHYTDGCSDRIVALEPDIKTFLKLREHCGALPNLQLFNMGIWNENTDLSFHDSEGRGSNISANGEKKLPVTTIDTLFAKRPLSYLKIDVEGAEEQALLGGKTVFRRDRPKVNMALYHRSEDIFKLPLLLKAINPDYRLYLRQHPHIPAWDLNLYAV